MNPISIPVVPAQPNKAVYGVIDLELFKRYTRDTYRAAFGEDPPDYDSKRLTKTWFDTSVQGDDAGLVVYHVLRGNQRAALTMTARDARTVNLPGLHSYPKYAIAPTSAFLRGGAGGAAQSFDPAVLSTREQAEELAAEWGLNATTVIDISQQGPFAVEYPANEPRRMWGVVFRNLPQPAGNFIAERNHNGVGAPGHWDLSGGEPNWISELPITLPPENPLMEVPVRDLLGNEAISVGLMGVTIFRTDMASAPNAPAGAGVGGGGLTQAEHAALARIDSNAQTLVKLAVGPAGVTL